MNKLITKVVGAALGLTMAIGVGVAVANSSHSIEPVQAANSTYAKVSSLSAGKQVLIVSHSSSGQYYLMDAVTAATSAGPKHITCSLTNSQITGDYDSHLFTVAASSTNWKFSTGSKYLKWSGTSSNTAVRINTGDSDNTWTYSNGSLKFSSATRYLGVYTAGTDWRSYNSSTAANYSGTGANIEFYEKSAAAQTYTVSFDGNGGTGSMSNVTDVPAGSYTMPSNGFTAPANKAFAGWKVKVGDVTGDTVYQVGSTSYTIGSNITLVAQWADQRTMTYSPVSSSGTGTGTMTDPNSPYGDGATVTVLASTFTAPQYKRFKEWRTNSDGTGTKYVAGDTFTISANTTLYAIWEDAPSEVVITMDEASGLSGSYAEGSWSSSGITGKVFAIKSTTQFQFSKNTGTSYFYNLDAVPGPITNITLHKSSGSYRSIEMFFGQSAITSKPDSGEISNNTDWSWDVDPDDELTYFYFWNNDTGAAYVDTVTITYQKVTLVDPTGITMDTTSISMDTYGFGGRDLTATVEPYNANNKNVTWGTNDASVVTVSNGVLTPVGAGTTTVYAHTSNYNPLSPVQALIKSVSVTVTQALYKKARFVVNSSKELDSADDYLQSGSASLSTTGSWNSIHEGIQLGDSDSATFTITGYKGMKITGVDIVMSSNASSGSGSLDVTAGSTNILTISAAAFSHESWNGAYNPNKTKLYRATTNYIVGNGESIVFAFQSTAKSLYISSVAVRYLDSRLEAWCTDFLSQITCTGVTQENPDGAISSDSNWGTLASSFAALDKDLRDIAASATANKDSESVIEQAMARYDLILRKYGIGNGAGQHTDFIGRFGVGTVNGPLNASMLLAKETNTSLVIIIAIASSIIGLATAGYFLLRKRKEQ